MSVLYRGLWADQTQQDPDAYLLEIRKRFCSWALEQPDAQALEDGSSEASLSQGRTRTIDLRSVADDGRVGLEAIARDQKAGDSSSWTTLIRSVAHEGTIHTLVENQMESDDLTIRVSVGRPRVVDDLLDIPGNAILGGSALTTGVVTVSADQMAVLTEILGSTARTLPVIVCSEPPGEHDDTWMEWAHRIASRVTGIASVIALDVDAVTAFRRRVGDLAIWGGGIRVYAPVPVGDPSEGWRHRFTVRHRLDSATQPMIDRIVYSVAQLSTRRRVPEVFSVFTDGANQGPGVHGGYVELSALEQERERWELDLDLELAERSEVEKELARATGHLARLKEALIGAGLVDLIWGTKHEVVATIPDEVQDTSEAVLAAQTYLSDWLVVPDSAPRELADIDTAPNTFAWGNTAWRGLRALAAYSEDRASGWSKGGFWEWCAEGPLLAWPATTKKLSMSESDTVQNNAKLRETRMFKVSEDVDPTGEVLMLAHLKIAEGGGNLAPRIYFYDDTGGATKRVHVGLVGPHYLVPNKQTN